jgi:energy-converting hydrogenase A subunit R
MKPRLICFDLEGPLSPQDNAYEVLSLIPGGRELFEVISRYDDILTLEGREGYEPGDTLALIAPFLIYHRITSEDICNVSSTARIVDGAGELIRALKSDGWNIRIISTSYREHAHSIGSQIGVSPEEIACTNLDLEKITAELGEKELAHITDLESEIADRMDDEDSIMKLLDRFFFTILPDTRYGNPLDRVRVVGGSRKVDAARKFAKDLGLTLGEIMVVGDSITDFKMLAAVRDAGGIAVAFNANMYALPYANFALATLDMRALDLLCREFPDSDKMVEVAANCEKISKKFKGADLTAPQLHYLSMHDDNLLKEVASIHARFREQVRGRASILG